jgi:hypothetical protein
MADDVVETFYGTHNKFEVVKRDGGVFSSATYYITKDGKHHRGSYSSLRDAVEAAKKESGDK